MGDQDIKLQTAEFFALYYFMRGMFNQAMEHFEVAERAFAASGNDRALSPFGIIYMGFCASYLGRHSFAIGSLDSNWHRAQRENKQVLATVMQAVLGTVLILIEKEDEARVHLEAAWKEPGQNFLAYYFATGGLALDLYRNDRIEEAHQLLRRLATEIRKQGVEYGVSASWVFEMLYEFHRLGLEPIKDYEFDSLIETVAQEPSLHLRGLVLRLKAKNLLASGGDPGQVEGILAASMECLEVSGDTVQLAKTLIDLASLKYNTGGREEARRLAYKARRGLSGHGESYFPDFLRFLLEKEPTPSRDSDLSEDRLGRALQAVDEFAAKPDMDRVLNKFVSSINRLLGTERGGLFWWETEDRETPVLRAARNLNRFEVVKPGFRGSLTAVFRSYKKEEPLVIKAGPDGHGQSGGHNPNLLCLPLRISGRTKGVLYFDNSHPNESFSALPLDRLKRLSGQLGAFLKKLIERDLSSEGSEPWSPTDTVRMNQPGDLNFIYRSQAMVEIIAQVDVIAATDSSVLIEGESGVGKELIARRLHLKSNRYKGPFITIDPTTIPESLVESDLFGYEKGAFTGADQRKKGRLEMAQNGTLFIDEVGEIPEHIQVKLLRVLQERKFVRVGGAENHDIDFRLVAATNRNLIQEVGQGRFRKDLYYRLSVLPLTVPPLRERKGDIMPLARHFLDIYKKRFNRPGLDFSKEDENVLTRYDWPGNVREMKNTIERAVVLSSSGVLRLDPPNADPRLRHTELLEDLPTYREMERRYIKHVLKLTQGRIGGPEGAAALMGIKRTTLYTRMKKLGVSTAQRT